MLSNEAKREITYTVCQLKHRKRPSSLFDEWRDVLVRNPRVPSVKPVVSSVGIYGKNDDTPSMGAFRIEARPSIYLQSRSGVCARTLPIRSPASN